MDSLCVLSKTTSIWGDPSWWQVAIGILGVVSSLLLAYIAIFGKEKFIKLEFTYNISKIDQQVNENTLQIFRIQITNRGKRAAKGVLVSAVEIRDKKNSKYYRRKDFIHMPLEWTHVPLENKIRNIAAGEDVYVDIGQYDLSDPGLKLFTNPRTSSKQLYAIENDAKIKLRLTEEHGFTEEVNLAFSIQDSGGDLRITNRKVLNKG